MYRLNFYVPEADLAKVKKALFFTGAGKIGDYEQCCWQVKGTGQFLPLENSQPSIGKIGTVERVPEYKVEMILADHLAIQAIDTLLSAHPYEEPAYDLVRILKKEDLSHMN